MVMTHDERIAIVTLRYDLINRHEHAAASELYAADAEVESPTAGTLKGRSAIRKVEEAWFTAFPDLEVTLEDVIVEGSRVVVIARFRGTHKERFLGMEPTGTHFEVPMVLVHTIDDGQIRHERRFYDFSGLLIRLGILKVKPG
jgi:steroid delta-isomerase-like uncharacterized protein